MSVKDRIQQLLEKDEREMKGIYDAVAAGIPPDAAAALVVGGEFRLSDYVQSALQR